MEPERQSVEIVLEQDGRSLQGRAILSDGFLIENERVLVKVRELVVEESNGGESSDQLETPFWIDVRDLKVDEPLVLRSEMWEIADGPDREGLLRSLAIVLARQSSFQSYRIDLARQFPGDVELLFYNAIVPDEGAAYQASLAPIRLRCNPRPLPWRPPAELLSSRTAPAKERYESHVSHLPLWLQSTRLWSVYLWDQGRFLHVLQFSLNQRLRPVIESRFKLKPVEAGRHSL